MIDGNVFIMCAKYTIIIFVQTFDDIFVYE